MNNIPQQKRIIAMLDRIWETVPDLRFFQLMYLLKLLYRDEQGVRDPFYISDDDLEEILTEAHKKYVKPHPSWEKNNE